MSAPALIAVDWGTTNARAYLLDRSGAVLDIVSDKKGILNVPEGGFAQAYLDLVGRWQLGGKPPALMAGMVGSRNGWVEAPYVACPADPMRLADGLVQAPMPDGREIWIVPGISSLNDGVHDVIRGEETQLAGAMAAVAGIAGPAVFCLPGTHSKWATVSDGTITGFRTAMTGEVFSLLAKHSILGKLFATGGPRGAGPAFERGLDRAGDAGGLLHHLFGVRAEALFGALSDADGADYLSGILIGHEINALGGGGKVTLIGSDALVERYRRALTHRGYGIETVPGEDAVVMGLWQIARQAGIVETGT